MPLTAKQTKQFINASYSNKAPPRVGEWEFDATISRPTARVYFHPKTGKAVVVHRGTKGVLDWGNNIAFLANQYKNTPRYWAGKDVQEKAAKKYGADNITTVAHSQGALIARDAGKQTHDVITVNPAYRIGHLHPKETVVRSENDIVSWLLHPVEKGREFAGLEPYPTDIVIPAKSNDILTEHSSDIIDRLPEDTILGGKCIMSASRKGKRVAKLNYGVQDIDWVGGTIAECKGGGDAERVYDERVFHSNDPRRHIPDIRGSNSAQHLENEMRRVDARFDANAAARDDQRIQRMLDRWHAAEAKLKFPAPINQPPPTDLERSRVRATYLSNYIQEALDDGFTRDELDPEITEHDTLTWMTDPKTCHLYFDKNGKKRSEEESEDLVMRYKWADSDDEVVTGGGKNPFRKLTKGFKAMQRGIDKGFAAIDISKVNPMAYAAKDKNARALSHDLFDATQNYIMPAVVSAGKPIYTATAATASTAATGNPILGKAASDALWNQMVAKKGYDPRQNQKSKLLGEVASDSGRVLVGPFKTRMLGRGVCSSAIAPTEDDLADNTFFQQRIAIPSDDAHKLFRAWESGHLGCIEEDALFRKLSPSQKESYKKLRLEATNKVLGKRSKRRVKGGQRSRSGLGGAVMKKGTVPVKIPIKDGKVVKRVKKAKGGGAGAYVGSNALPSVEVIARLPEKDQLRVFELVQQITDLETERLFGNPNKTNEVKEDIQQLKQQLDDIFKPYLDDAEDEPSSDDNHSISDSSDDSSSDDDDKGKEKGK